TPAPPAAAAPPESGGGAVIPPKLVNYPSPEYPPLARRLGVQGTVIVSVLVDESGRVAEARIVEPVKQQVGINEAALSAARAARFRPATKGDVPTKMWTRLKIPFKL
ncbi:MAG TPA: TonB family protein, partial [Thermoanaerobaculia bacterium]